MFSDPVLFEHRKRLEEEGASIYGLILFVAIPWIPLLFYGTCLLSCFITRRNRISAIVGAIVFGISIPYFMALYGQDPSTAKIGLYAGTAAIVNHLKQTSNSSSGGQLLSD